MAGNDTAVFHLVNPIARFRDRRIVRDEQQSFLTLVDEILEQLEGALRIQGVEVAGWLVSQNHGWIIGERARNRYALLFATGKMPARAPPLITKIDSFQ